MVFSILTAVGGGCCENNDLTKRSVRGLQNVDPLVLYDFFTNDSNAINSGLTIFAQVC